jgi:hypothetical protein
MHEEKTTQVEVNAAERKVLELLRSLEFGQITVTIKRGAPVHVDEIRKAITLPPVK